MIGALLIAKRMQANYNKLPEWERTFDTLLLVAVVIGAILAVLPYFLEFSQKTISIFHGIDIAIFFIFILDLLFAYYRINHLPTFIRHSALDATILFIGFFATSYMLYAGATRVTQLLKINKIHKISSFYHLGAIGKRFK